MRILTRTQYDAICDIVTDLKKENEKLKAQIVKKDATIDYLNDIVFRRDKQIRNLIHGTHLDSYLIDFPATQKPENIIF